jgi:hypothetical protein
MQWISQQKREICKKRDGNQISHLINSIESEWVKGFIGVLLKEFNKLGNQLI